MGRTRPKKLTSKASIPIVREDQIDAIDEDVQSALQQVETGVEKAEESVRIFLFSHTPGPYVSRDIYDAIRENFSRQPIDRISAFRPDQLAKRLSKMYRNSIFKLPSMLSPSEKSARPISPLPKPS